MRWFTAHKTAKLEGPAQWGFASGLYFGVDEQGVVQKRCDQRPKDAQIIHDLGHALLTPPGLLAFEMAPFAFDQPGALRAFLLAQRQLGRVALSKELAQVHAKRLESWVIKDSMPEILDLSALDQVPRRLIQACSDESTQLVGALEVSDPFDVAVWDLDAPQLFGLSEALACELIWKGEAGAGVKEIWLAGQRLF